MKSSKFWIAITIASLFASCTVSSMGKKASVPEPVPTPDTETQAPENYDATWVSVSGTEIQGKVYNGTSSGDRALKFVQGDLVVDIIEASATDFTCYERKSKLSDPSSNEVQLIGCNFTPYGVVLLDGDTREKLASISFDTSTSDVEQKLME